MSFKSEVMELNKNSLKSQDWIQKRNNDFCSAPPSLQLIEELIGSKLTFRIAQALFYHWDTMQNIDHSDCVKNLIKDAAARGHQTAYFFALNPGQQILSATDVGMLDREGFSIAPTTSEGMKGYTVNW